MSDLQQTCTRCKELKGLDAFWKRGSGLHYYCKPCTKAVNRKWKNANPERYMWHTAKARAKKEGLPFTITPEDLTIPETCPMLGIPLIKGLTYSTDNSPSLDRTLPSLGYVQGNIRVISYRANRIKNDATLAELRLIVEALEAYE